MTTGFEVHEHCYVSGPNANRGRRLVHSHFGGDTPHEHAHTGPASFTIDKDEWFARTGLRGGGRKKFTKEPSGEQLARVELQDWQKTFEVIVYEKAQAAGSEASAATGPGVAPAERLRLSFGMTVSRVRTVRHGR